MKKLYKATATIKIETYFVLDDQEEPINEAAIRFLFTEEYYNLKDYYHHALPKPAIKVSEITSSTQISDDWKKGECLVWGIKDDLTPHQWLLKAFL